MYASMEACANPLLARVDPALGSRLLALPYKLVWATTWESEANECLAPLLGLPQLPVVTRPEPSDEPEPMGPHGKTRTLLDWSAGRPFAWLDDQITDSDRIRVEVLHPAQTLLRRVDHRRGITDADFAALGGWPPAGCSSWMVLRASR